jgi:4-amino-4-deoxy-L-arabinose transferase-like glycosyltransferase
MGGIATVWSLACQVFHVMRRVVLIYLDNHSENWSRRFWMLLVGVFLFRVFFTLFFCSQADLSGDEAYYWDWGRRLDWGYYSKPPMIGWLMGLVGWLTGACDVGIRMTALVLGTMTLAVLFVFIRSLYDARVGFISAVLLLLTPANAGLNLFLTIDAPLLLCWSSALLLFWLAVQKPHCWTRWLALAVVIGLGTLSKQMMLGFPLLMLVFVTVSKEKRTLLRNGRMWTAILLGVAFLTPVLLWQQKHEWVTLEHTAHHFNTESLSGAEWLVRCLEWPLVQALIYSPVIWAAMLCVMIHGVRCWNQMAQRERYLLIFCVPALHVFTLLSLRQRINPNWSAVFWVPALLLVAAWFGGHLQIPRMQVWRAWALRMSGGLVLLAHLLITLVFLTSLKGHKKLAEMRGWRETGEQAGMWLSRVPRPKQTFVMALGHRYHAAQMAFNMPQHPRVYRYESSGHPKSQYEIWPGAEERIGEDGLIFTSNALPTVVASSFESVERLGRVEVPLGDKTRVYEVFLGRKLKTWVKVPNTKP